MIKEEWLPIIYAGLEWLVSKIGSSKKSQKIRITELENQVQSLIEGNRALCESFSLIMQAIITEIQASSSYTINTDSIIYNGSNSGSLTIEQHRTSNKSTVENIISDGSQTEHDISKIFDGIDEEIAHTRSRKPSDRNQ